MQLDEFLKKMVERGGSDAHLKVGMPPGVRVSGVLMPQGDESLRPQHTEEIARTLLDEQQWKEFEERGDMDCSYSIAGVARFRVNVLRQRGSISIVLRNIPAKVPTFDDLGLPDICKTLVRETARSRPGHRADGERQIDDAGGDDQFDQFNFAWSHTHDGGSHRVPSPR